MDGHNVSYWRIITYIIKIYAVLRERRIFRQTQLCVGYDVLYA